MTQAMNSSDDVLRASAMVDLMVRLKNEHMELRNALDDLESVAALADRMPTVLSAAHELRRIRQPLLAFMDELERHTAWEEEELLPLIDNYYHRLRMPTLTASIWVMEKDHELANTYLNAFLDSSKESGSRPHAGMVAEAIRCLQQGCHLLKEHFRIEEQTLFPLAEQYLGGERANS